MSEKSNIEAVTVRRSPKYLRFFLFGVAVGALGSIVIVVPFIGVSSSTDGIPVYQIVGFFVLFGSAIGGVLGLALALIFDMTMRRKLRVAQAQRTVTTEQKPRA